MKKLENKLKIYLIVGIVSFCVLWVLISEHDNRLDEKQLPTGSDQNIYLENAYLDMPLEQLLEVVVDEQTSATMSREALCYILNGSCTDVIS